MIKKLMVLTTTALISYSGVAYADGLRLNFNSDSKMISELPKSGEVTLSGKVDSVQDEKKFTIIDKYGKTIDINTHSPVEVKKGETITITGDLDSEFMGMGKEIDNANISRVGLDLDSDAGHDVSLSTHNDNDEDDNDDNDDNTKNGKHSEIKALPDKGEVEFTAVVEDVKSENKIIVKDSSGETIDVNSKDNAAFNVKVGDRVRVSGMKESEAAGMGEQIVSGKVSKL